MRSALRSIAAVILGFIVASIVMMIVESINGRFLHPALGKAAEGLKDREAIRTLLATAPVTAFLVVISSAGSLAAWPGAGSRRGWRGGLRCGTGSSWASC